MSVSSSLSFRRSFSSPLFKSTQITMLAATLLLTGAVCGQVSEPGSGSLSASKAAALAAARKTVSSDSVATTDDQTLRSGPGAAKPVPPPVPAPARVMPPQGVPWKPLGPDGGDVRSLAQDPGNPDRIYMGTSAGQLYLSLDAGLTWSRYARLGEGDDYVLDHIVIDPNDANIIYVAAWSIESGGGDLFRSQDGGHTWQILPGMHGKSIRAFGVAPSNSHVLVAGALDGVFRSSDEGDTWARISPESHRELKNVESLAIDPANPDIVYIGTWHLPWKTADGGQTWSNIKQGVVDDSDVFSIIIDPKRPSVVYASACSGIYKSENAGGLFEKVKGMPFSARRTRVMKQDPVNPSVVYAGTTEGLWKTMDGGKTFHRMTDPNVIVNDVMVDPRDPEHLLIATDRSGIMSSNNGGKSFINSSRGFSHRQVATILVDRQHPEVFYAGMINDKEFGGVFISQDAGASWRQISNGLGTRDVFTLRQAEDGEVLAGTNRGIFTLNQTSYVWKAVSSGNNGMPSIVTVPKIPKKSVLRKVVRRRASRIIAARPPSDTPVDRRVTALDFADGKWFAATSAGFFTSANQGKNWIGGPVLGFKNFVAVHAAPEMLLLASRNALVISPDGGNTWKLTNLPDMVTSISDVAMDPERSIWVATREGAFRSRDNGETWDHVGGLPVNNLTSVTYDAQGRRLLITSSDTTQIFQTRDFGMNWRREDSGWELRSVLAVRGRLLGVTAFDGIVLQPGGFEESTTASDTSPQNQTSQ